MDVPEEKGETSKVGVAFYPDIVELLVHFGGASTGNITLAMHPHPSPPTASSRVQGLTGTSYTSNDNHSVPHTDARPATSPPAPPTPSPTAPATSSQSQNEYAVQNA